MRSQQSCFRRITVPLGALVLSLTGQASGALTYTCDPSVSSTACAYLNTTIAGLYDSAFSNVTASIYVKMGKTGLGESAYFLTFVTYSQYLAALTAVSQTSGNSVQVSAVSALNSLDTTLYGNYQVEVSSPLGRSFGFPNLVGTDQSGGKFCLAPGTSGCYDGVITISNNVTLYYRQGTEPRNAYDFYSTVEHETDEILGTSSCIETTGSSLSNGCGDNIVAAVDLFRYQSPGSLVLISTTPGAYFSYDGGQTNGAGIYKKVYNTLDDGDDYADFLVPSCPPAHASVQDAEACSGDDGNLDITNDGGAETAILTAVGFKPASRTIPSVSNVQNAASFQTQALAPGTYLAIFGSNLSTDAQGRTWSASDFTSNPDGTLNLPTELDGTYVTVGNVRAYLYYVSAMQLNIITPATIAAGNNVPVVVYVNNQPSASFNVNLESLAPAFFAWYPGTSENGKYLIAQHLNYTNVGPPGLFPGSAPNFTTPAQPGEIIQLYGTGFGPTSPPITAGIETDKVYNLSPTPAATVGGIPATVVFAGLIPSLAQVYQIDVTIPGTAPNGDLALVVTVGGVNSYSGLITVQAPTSTTDAP